MKIAVVIPCLNEELTVGRVVADCRRELPSAEIVVFDNGSVDETSARAAAAGARVIPSPLRGKGNVLRHAFRVLDADYFVMIDGDGTYPAHEMRRLVDLARARGYEMVSGARLDDARREAFRPLHYVGNRVFTFAVRALFGFPVRDLLTGFRVFSRRFAREVTLLSRGFEVETEITVRAIAQDMAFVEVPIPYVERPVGSRSKLRTFRDGWRILVTMIWLLKDFRPLAFYVPLAVSTAPFSLVGACVFVALGLHADSSLRAQRLRLPRTDARPEESRRAA